MLSRSSGFGRLDFRGYHCWHELNDLLSLARMAVARSEDHRHTHFSAHDPIAVSIVLDRRPDWMADRIVEGTRSRHGHFSTTTWMLLRKAGLVKWSMMPT